MKMFFFEVTFHKYFNIFCSMKNSFRSMSSICIVAVQYVLLTIVKSDVCHPQKCLVPMLYNQKYPLNNMHG
jgi:hypothetical protein